MLPLCGLKIDFRSQSDHINRGTRMSNSSAEEEVEGSWLPFMAVAALAVIWWLSFSQSQSAVKLRRSYHMQVCDDELLCKKTSYCLVLKTPMY